MSVLVECWGDYACFSRPEMKVERVSYDVPTPSAMRGLLEAVYWHPGMRWVIDKIYVEKPIRFTSIRRNEVKCKLSAANARTVMLGGDRELAVYRAEEIVQRTSLILRDVRYVVKAHFEMTEAANESDNPGKFQDIIKRRLRRGQCYHQPYFGCREYPARFALYEGAEKEIKTYEGAKEEEPLGYMLYDKDYGTPGDIRPRFFRAVLRRGVLDLTDCEVVE